MGGSAFLYVACCESGSGLFARVLRRVVFWHAGVVCGVCVHAMHMRMYSDAH